MLRISGCMVLAIAWMSNVRAQGTYHMMRYDDNYEYLKDSSNRSWYDKLKYSPLDKRSARYLSVGGEVRYQYFRINHEDWGDAPRDNDGFILTRYLLHADIHYHPTVRLFMQLQSSLSDGRVEETPPGEQNELDLHQAFADVTLIRRPSSTIYFRVGRQEMSYGAGRLVSVREGPNTRQAFDGAKLLFVSTDVRGDMFYTHYVAGREGVLNDRFWNRDKQFWGTYWTINYVPGIQTLDLYYLGIKDRNARWNDLEGGEVRHSVGARSSGKCDRLTYDFEGVYQFGDMVSKSVAAWTLSSHTTYTLGNTEESASLGLKTELISGDRRAGDGKIQSFNPLFPRGAYFGYAALIGPSNLFDLHPSWTIPLSPLFEVDIDYDIFWRYASADGIYNQDASLLYSAGDHHGEFIGHQISGNIEFTGRDHVFVRTEVTWFHAADYLDAVSAGKDIFFVGMTTRFRF